MTKSFQYYATIDGERKQLDAESVQDLHMEERFGFNKQHGDFTITHNYFLNYWAGPLGSKSALIYLQLSKYCYGAKDYAFPSLSTLCEEVGAKKPETINAALVALEENGLLMVVRTMNGKKSENNRYIIRKSIPFISEKIFHALSMEKKNHHKRYLIDLLRRGIITAGDIPEYIKADDRSVYPPTNDTQENIEHRAVSQPPKIGGSSDSPPENRGLRHTNLRAVNPQKSDTNKSTARDKNIKTKINNIKEKEEEEKGVIPVEAPSSSEGQLLSIFTQEFGRRLTGFEREQVLCWKKDGHTDEMIIEALRESVLAGVRAMRYTGAILMAWNKSGIVSPDQITLHHTKRAVAIDGAGELRQMTIGHRTKPFAPNQTSHRPMCEPQNNKYQAFYDRYRQREAENSSS